MRSAVAAVLVPVLLSPGTACSQDLEPRRWTQLPVGMNIAGAGLLHASGEIFFDPVLKLDDVTVESQSLVVSYLRGFDLLGRSARLDLRLPYTRSRWEGLLNGEPASAVREGPADPLLRLSVNLLGAPALEGKALREHRASRPVATVIGAALSIRLPLGEYFEDKLLNLGENRYVFGPQVGVVHTRGRWSYELTTSAFLYTDNEAFFGGNTLEQEPLLTLQGHVVHASGNGWWVSLGVAGVRGGESSINGERQDDASRDRLYGISSGVPLGPRSSIKLTYVGTRTGTDTGGDIDRIALSGSVAF